MRKFLNLFNLNRRSYLWAIGLTLAVLVLVLHSGVLFLLTAQSHCTMESASFSCHLQAWLAFYQSVTAPLISSFFILSFLALALVVAFRLRHNFYFEVQQLYFKLISHLGGIKPFNYFSLILSQGILQPKTF